MCYFYSGASGSRGLPRVGSTDRSAMSRLVRCVCSSSATLLQQGAGWRAPAGRRAFRTFPALWDLKAPQGRSQPTVTLQHACRGQLSPGFTWACVRFSESLSNLNSKVQFRRPPPPPPSDFHNIVEDGSELDEECYIRLPAMLCALLSPAAKE